MKRPSHQTMILGQPVVALTVGVTSTITAFAAYRSGDSAAYAIEIGCGALIVMAVRANEAATAYKRWKREWGAMDEPDGRRPTSGLKCKLEWALASLIALAILAALGGQPTYLLALLLLGLPLLATKLVRGLRRRLTRRPGTKVRPVTVVATPLMSTPTLAEAYARLPDHCQRILGRS